MPALRTAALLALACGVLLAADEPKKPTPKFKPDKAVTFVTEPLDADGYIDYEAALNERLKGKATPETNAVVLLLKCFGPKPEGTELQPDFYKAIGIDPPPEKGDYLVSYNKVFADIYQSGNPDDVNKFNDLESRLRKRPWTAADSPKHTEYLTANEKPLAVAMEATKRPHYFHPMIARTPDGKRGQLMGALLPTVQKSREIASLLSLRVTLKLGAGQVDEAFADALTLHRLSRLLGRGGTLIELLVAIAIEAIAHNCEMAVLEHGRPTAKQAVAYQAELLRLPKMPTTLDKLNSGERFMGLDAVTGMARNGVQGGGEFFGGIGEIAGGQTPEEMNAALDFELILRRMNEGYDKLAVVLDKPTHAERVAANATWEKELREVRAKLQNMTPLQKFFLMAERPEKRREKVSENVAAVLVGLLMPAVQKVGEASQRGEQIHRNGIIATGLAAHFADRKAYPEKLADLAPKYLTTVPDDAFTGKALIYKRTDAGYVLYSVGTNGKDDGGKLLTDEPRGDDVGVRMPRK